MRPSVIFIATYDTKGIESDFIKRQIKTAGVDCTTVDVGVGDEPTAKPDVSLADLCKGSAYSVKQIRSMSRGEAVKVASMLVENYVANLYACGKISAIIGIGGAGGTQIVTQTMRTLPFGLPKLMLSTLAAGNMRWYLEDSDIMMLPSVADVAGLNCITETVFSRLASMAAQAACWYATTFPSYHTAMEDSSVVRIGQTMYGTTTKGVTAARQTLEKFGYETIVFHASGAGGRSMERFIRQGVIHGVLDMTLAEIGGHLVGGLHNAGPCRLEAGVEMGIPMVIVPGAADTVVLPPLADVPERFRTGRVLNHHNPTMTTMRTTAEENIKIGEFIVAKLKNATNAVKVLLPCGGLSSIDRPGEIFYAPEANQALFDTLKHGLAGTAVEVVEDARHLYTPGFSEDAAALLQSLIEKQNNLKEKAVVTHG